MKFQDDISMSHTCTQTHRDKPKPIYPPLFQSWGHKKEHSKTRLRSHLSSDGGVNSSHMSNKSHSDFLPKQTNLRLLTVNCCSVCEHKAEFLAGLDYVKPDLICGTESWLNGIKPGKEPSKTL